MDPPHLMCAAICAILTASFSPLIAAAAFTPAPEISKQLLRLQRTRNNHQHSVNGRSSLLSTPEDDVISDPRGRLIFPGGGLFFYWQAGVVEYMREASYDLSATRMSGASAGALAATLAATGVDCYDATELALDLAEEAGVWDRPLGLQGVWGSMIEEWLERLLPSDADEIVKDTLHVIVTPVPSFGKSRISRFQDRRDLIKANMASVHLPWFLDGKLTSDFRGSSYIDGSFLAKKSDYFPDTSSEGPTLVLDYKRDPVMADKASEFIKVISKQSIWDILEQGRSHAKLMDQRGDFDDIPRTLTS